MLRGAIVPEQGTNPSQRWAAGAQRD